MKTTQQKQKSYWKQILQTTLLTLALSILLFVLFVTLDTMRPLSGLVMAILYVPGNIGMPLLLLVSLYHFGLKASERKSDSTFRLPTRILALAALVTIGLGIWFGVDLWFFNSNKRAAELFRVDYRGWLIFVLPSVMMIPWFHHVFAPKD